MRSMIRAAWLALTLAAAPASAALGQTVPKLGYIDSRAVLQQAPGRAEAEKQFEQEMTTFRQQIQRMEDSLRTMVTTFQQQEATLSPSARDGRGREIRAKEEEYQRRVQQLEQQAQQRQVELIQPIMQRINKAIEDVRAEENFSMIFDVGSNAGVVVAADKTLDITPRVLARLGVTASATPPTSRPPGAQMPAPAGVTRPRTPPDR